MSPRGALATQPARRPDERGRPRTTPQAVPASRRRGRPRIRLRLGLTVIPLLAVLFAGVVWLNSAKLAITKKQGQVARSTVLVREELSALKSRQAQSDGAVRKAAEEMGMIQPKSGAWIYLPARPGR